MGNKKIISVVAVVLAVCLIVAVAYVVKNNGAIERNVEEGKNNSLLASNSEKDSEKKDVETNQEENGNNEKNEETKKEDNTSEDKVENNVDNGKTGDDTKVEEGNGSNDSENNSEEGNTEVGSETGEDGEGNISENSGEEGSNEGQEDNEGDMRERIGLDISKIINSNKITINGETFKGVNRGTIVTHAYSEEFKKVAGNYIIKTQEEYLHFLSLIIDRSFAENTELASVDFDKYAIVIKTIQSNSSGYSYDVNGVIIGENGLDIDFTVSGSGMTCDMARFYPYVVIEKEKITKDTYEGWKSPLEVESPFPTM